MEGSVRNVVLLCEGCGERTVLGGPLSVWRCGSTSFECECGLQLTLSHQLDPSEAMGPAETHAGALYRQLIRDRTRHAVRHVRVVRSPR
jgi:hypothetical protein